MSDTSPRIDRPLPRVTLREGAAHALRQTVLTGRLAPGAPVVEAALARSLGISRAPLREAIRELLDEGLLVQHRAWGGVTVAPLDATVARELYTLRTALEVFAFEHVWDRRDDAFRSALSKSHAALTQAIDMRDDEASIAAEFALHNVVYEAAGHGLLLQSWSAIRGRLALYWAAHHRAHGRPGPRRDAHDDYIRHAIGPDLDAMREELHDHMQRGLSTVLRFIENRKEQAS
ncbi:MAG: GntR family transcriptional regulator [Alphaproteobacteria bacterium]|nr:GntR family transcriptional regulator [Alphaproteobacteria bacterium]